MLMLQLFIFALLFLGFGIFSMFRGKKLIGFTFVLMGVMLAVLGLIVIYLYPEKSPFS
jgi:hypothetical protein